MYFFERNENYIDRTCCIDDEGREYTYGQIWDMGDELTEGASGVVMLECSNDAESLARYLALLRRKCPVILVGKNLDEDTKEALDPGDGAITITAIGKCALNHYMGNVTPQVMLEDFEIVKQTKWDF